MFAVQCKMARVALGIGVREIAEMAGVSANTISRFERGEELKASTVQTIREAFERQGAVFIDPTASEGPGVRLRDTPAAPEAE